MPLGIPNVRKKETDIRLRYYFCCYKLTFDQNLSFLFYLLYLEHLMIVHETKPGKKKKCYFKHRFCFLKFNLFFYQTRFLFLPIFLLFLNLKIINNMNNFNAMKIACTCSECSSQLNGYRMLAKRTVRTHVLMDRYRNRGFFLFFSGNTNVLM